ncbi:MAG: sel1 repeat family protein [Colwellia sp.]
MSRSSARNYEDEQMHTADVDQQKASQAEFEQAELADVDPPSNENTKKEPYYHYTIDTKDPDPWLVKHRAKLIFTAIFAVASVAGLVLFKNHESEAQTKSIIAAPELNDLYYIDFRVIKTNLRPTEKYRMAKVKDVTGDVITINFSTYFYMQEHELNEAIRYAQLRYEKFFQEKRHNYKISELQAMIKSGAIVLARRPEGNVLDGNVVVPDSHFAASSLFIPGKKENFTGLEHLKYAKDDIQTAQDGLRAEQAFTVFEESADLGYPPGIVSLAQMYLTGTAVEKDLYETLALLKESALQSYEPAILKYAIVCQQVESCMISDFYQELIKKGVNIEFTKQIDIRATTKDFERTLKEAEENKSIRAKR